MSKRKQQRQRRSDPQGAQPTKTQTTSRKATLAGETVEPRILLSATWITGTDNDDTIAGGEGDDQIDGGLGYDTVDYSGATGSVTVDLTQAGAQATGGAGSDTLVGVEGVIGSAFDDTFAFANPVDGALYTVDGGSGGPNTIDLTKFASTDVTFGDGVMTIDLGGGQSFQIVHDNVRDIDFGDVSATVVGSDTNADSWIGSRIFVDGSQAFRIDQSGAGSIDWSYDVASDTFTLTDTNDTDATTDVVIRDLSGSDLNVGAITIDSTLGALTSDVDIGSITISNGADHICVVTVAGGTGTVGTFATTGGDLGGTSTIRANVDTVSLDQDLKGQLTIDGNVGTIVLHNLDSGGMLHVTGDVGHLTLHDVNDTLDIDGDLTGLVVHDLRVPTTITGDVGSITANKIDAVLTIGGDLDTAVIDSVTSTGTIRANQVIGLLDIRVDGTQRGSIFLLATDYTFSGATQTTSVNVIGNIPPIADAGTDQLVGEGDLVTLSGLGSSDADGDVLSYTWVQTGGPAVVLSDASAAQPTFTAPEGLSNTAVQFQLRVSDGNSSSVVDNVTITIEADDDAPTADAGGDQLVTEGELVTLTGAGSSDPEGQALTYTWVQTAGPTVTLSNPAAANPSFTAPEGIGNTTLQFELTVGDGVNLSTDTVTIGLQADDDAPTADAGPNMAVAEGERVTLDGRGSSDPEGGNLRYQWTQVGGPAVTLSTSNGPTLTFDAPESISNTRLDFVLTVSDGTTSSSDSVSVFVDADDDAPSVDAGQSRIVRHGESVQLAATASDPENQALVYQWTQTGGPAVVLAGSNRATPTFTAPNVPEGAVLRFEVGVSDGATTTFDTVDIVIAKNDGPQVAIQAPAEAVEGDAVFISAGAVDPDGDPLSYRWTQVGGPQVTLPQSDRPVLAFTAPDVTSPVSLTFQVDVSDGHVISTQTVVVAVQPAAATETAGRTMQTATTATTATPSQEVVVSTTQRAAPIETPEPIETSIEPMPQPIAADDDGQRANSTQYATSLAEMTSYGQNSNDTLAVSRIGVDTETSTASENGVADDDVDYDGFLATNLLDDEVSGASTGASTRFELPDLVVGEAGNELELTPRLDADSDPAEVENVRWTQISGTRLTLNSVEGTALRVSLPEVFVEEELVFEVELYRGGERVVQEVTVQVQPVGLTSRSLSIDEHGPQMATVAVADDDEGAGRGLGKIWGALLAFFGAQGGRRKE